MSLIEINSLKHLLEQAFIDSVAGTLKGVAIPIGVLTKTGKIALENLCDAKFKDEVRFYIHSDDLLHIYNRHYGLHEKDLSNLEPLNIDDIKSIADILSHPDEIVYLGDSANGKRMAMVLQNAEGYYCMIEVCAAGKGRLTTKSLYKRRKGPLRRDILLKAHHCTSKTAGATLSGANIPILLESK